MNERGGVLSVHAAQVREHVTTQMSCFQQMSYYAPGPIRTADPLLRRQMLYPPELQAQKRGLKPVQYIQFLNSENQFHSVSVSSGVLIKNSKSSLVTGEVFLTISPSSISD